MTKLRDKSPILLCVDIQMGFELDEEYWGGGRNNKNAEQICGDIIHQWRKLDLDIIHIRHSSLIPESRLHASHAGFAFHRAAMPLDHEPVITKSVNSGFIGTNLKEMIDAKNANTLVIIGLTTDHCISTTTRMAGNLGYNTYLVHDATACFNRIGIDGKHIDAETMHQSALASLHKEFATVLHSTELLDLVG